jgi:hypothetical protein
MGGRQAGRGFSSNGKTHCPERKEELAEEFILEYSSTKNSCPNEINQ